MSSFTIEKTLKMFERVLCECPRIVVVRVTDALREASQGKYLKNEKKKHFAQLRITYTSLTPM